jgi:hypothetical protein
MQPLGECLRRIAQAATMMVNEFDENTQNTRKKLFLAITTRYIWITSSLGPSTQLIDGTSCVKI